MAGSSSLLQQFSDGSHLVLNSGNIADKLKKKVLLTSSQEVCVCVVLCVCVCAMEVFIPQLMSAIEKTLANATSSVSSKQ